MLYNNLTTDGETEPNNMNFAVMSIKTILVLISVGTVLATENL